MINNTPEALRLARMIEHYNAGVGSQRIVEDYQQAAAELRRLHDENEALKAAQYECGFGAGCCYQAAKSEADEALLRQALDALEILRNGLIQMREHAESYGEAWSRAYIKEYRDLLPGSAEEQFRALNAMQHRLADVADGVVKGFDAIAALRARVHH